MRGSFKKGESGVGLALEQHSTRLQGMCPFGCSYSVQRGVVYVGYYVFPKKTHMKNSQCNPNQLGGFACDYVRGFPIQLSKLGKVWILLRFFFIDTHFSYCPQFRQGERSAIHTFWNKSPAPN
jgi:hypothetical protein